MLRNVSEIQGYAVAASDGRLGTVSDFLFDDATWRVRWLVVDTGGWLSGRKVLLPPSVLGHLDAVRHEFSVKLDKQHVKDSPDIDTERPVSRQAEASVYDYYGWNPYWGNGFYMGGYGAMAGAGMMPPMVRQAQEEDRTRNRQHDDPHLRSVRAVTGYHIHATDGEIGHVENFLIEDADWSLRYLVVDTKNWWPGKKVLISPRSVVSIEAAERLVNLDIAGSHLKNSPPYESSMTVDRAYEALFHSYYGGIDPDKL